MEIRKYRDYTEFEKAKDRYARECITLVNQRNGSVCATLTTKCSDWRTAVDRFFQALTNDTRFDGWYERVVAGMENGIWCKYEKVYDTDIHDYLYNGGWRWEIGYGSDGTWCIAVDPGTVADR